MNKHIEICPRNPSATHSLAPGASGPPHFMRTPHPRLGQAECLNVHPPTTPFLFLQQATATVSHTFAPALASHPPPLPRPLTPLHPKPRAPPRSATCPHTTPASTPALLCARAALRRRSIHHRGQSRRGLASTRHSCAASQPNARWHPIRLQTAAYPTATLSYNLHTTHLTLARIGSRHTHVSSRPGYAAASLSPRPPPVHTLRVIRLCLASKRHTHASSPGPIITVALPPRGACMPPPSS
jgi:hypothetical protein